MATYLLTWNAKFFQFDNFDKEIKRVLHDEFSGWYWSCGVTRTIQKGDRLFLIRLGRPPKGIVASGWATSNIRVLPHWDSRLAKRGKTSRYVRFKPDIVLNPENEVILPLSELQKGVFKEMHWDTQGSGKRIPDHIARELEKRWMRLIGKHSLIISSLPEEDLLNPTTFSEGGRKQVSLNIYERNSRAREACIRHYGYDCFICGFNFERTYGEVGKNYIHVHHRVPLSKIGKKYRLNPIRDLRPVCPNCHAMIHRNSDALPLEELRRHFLRNKKNL